MVFEQLANAVLSFVNWGITIVVIMLIWEIIQFIRGGTEERGDGTSGIGKKSLGEIKEGFNKWTGRDEVEKKKKVKRAASREETKLLSEYIEEKKELGLIEEAQQKLLEFETVVNGAVSSKSIPKTKFTEAYKNLVDAVEEAGKETNRLKRVTFRQERRSGQLIKELEKAEVKDKDLNELRSLENYILQNHDKLIKEIATAFATLKDSGLIGKAVKVIAKSKAASIPITAGIIEQNIGYIHGELNAVEANLKAAASAQDNAYTAVKSLVAQFRKLWEK